MGQLYSEQAGGIQAAWVTGAALLRLGLHTDQDETGQWRGSRWCSQEQEQGLSEELEKSASDTSAAADHYGPESPGSG